MRLSAQLSYMEDKFRFAIDRGGTFTDVYAECPGGKIRVLKLLSEDPTNYADAPREAIRRILEEELKVSCKNEIDTRHIEWIRMGTTVATNALLERKGKRMALLITKGFEDLLYIGNQARPNIFDLEIVCPEVLYEHVIEVEERVVLQQESCQLGLDGEEIVGITGEKLVVVEKINKIKLEEDLKTLLDKGITSLAVALMHSYTFDGHEKEVASMAKSLGFEHVSLSSAVMPMVKIVPRGYTACADAYLTPCIQQYIHGFQSGFDSGLKNIKVLFMQSDGGLTEVQRFSGSRAILSGPAGGVVGYAMTAYNSQPVIGFDMGGTSTDVSRYAGVYEHVFETTTAGVTIQAPQLDINTVAAGGGSQLFFRAGLFVVGPESAGAHPGPTCYRNGGPLTVTDANLLLGRLIPDYFPHIFGKSKGLPLDKDATRIAFDDLTSQVNAFLAAQPESSRLMTQEDVAMGFIRVANEAMCRPIRALTQGKGYDTARHVLACFGGAGGQHACAIARNLGMKKVFIHRYAGILSAYGLAMADVIHECQEPCAQVYEESSFNLIDERLDVLIKRSTEELKNQGFTESNITVTPYLNMRYHGTDCALMCPPISKDTGNGCRHGDFLYSFISRYKREFGFTLSGRRVFVDDIRVRATGHSQVQSPEAVKKAEQTASPIAVVQCFFENSYYDTNVYHLESLGTGHSVSGPAILMETNSTILVEPGCCAAVTDKGDIEIEIGSVNQQQIGLEMESIQLSIFSHRFMSIAEQMGRVLQRTAISTNIKERLDFSCALFGPDGGLVANAPHIPVHLGAMQEAVRWQIRFYGDNLHKGDVILTNHPAAGGSHLPDLTVVTPVFTEGQPKPIFFVANRGHHADIGGTTPGSMPPHSKALWEEGMAVMSFKLVEGGVFQEKSIVDLLMSPAQYPNSSGTRNLEDNLSDLRAQVAANEMGITLVGQLIEEYSLEVVQAYMHYIQENAEVAVRQMLQEIATKTEHLGEKQVELTVLEAEDHMDDGTPLCLKITINKQDGTAVFDFSGTGNEVKGNWNAPHAVVFSALIYCLRCMVGHDVPLNQGCLVPITTIIPSGSLLDPSEQAAVIGGNVLTSQRIVDVIFKAFSTCAASQGCMNNTTFGDDSFAYYETVAGGAGAGPSWHGRSGVHTHMTNTRITDPEILEKRYPVVVKQFAVNVGSGGDGLYVGGNGVTRELLFRRPLTLCVLSERRGQYKPYGMNGGSPGHIGENWVLRRNGEEENLGGKNTAQLEPGDVFLLKTPGGGGFGQTSMEVPKKKRKGTGVQFAQKGSIADYNRLQESA